MIAVSSHPSQPPLGVHLSYAGHLTNSKCPAVGGVQITLTPIAMPSSRKLNREWENCNAGKRLTLAKDDLLPYSEPVDSLPRTKVAPNQVNVDLVLDKEIMDTGPPSEWGFVFLGFASPEQVARISAVQITPHIRSACRDF